MRSTLYGYCGQTGNRALLDQWDADRNTPLSPKKVSFGNSSTLPWWRCEEGHSRQTRISNRAAGAGCPYCTNRLVLQGYNDLTTTHPYLVEERDTERNGSLKPTEVTAGSHKKAWWKCRKGHSWTRRSAIGRAAATTAPYARVM